MAPIVCAGAHLRCMGLGERHRRCRGRCRSGCGCGYLLRVEKTSKKKIPSRNLKVTKVAAAHVRVLISQSTIFRRSLCSSSPCLTRVGSGQTPASVTRCSSLASLRVRNAPPQKPKHLNVVPACSAFFFTATRNPRAALSMNSTA